MPFCCQCGSTVGGGDAFCFKCGARQPVAPTARPVDYMSGISPRTASLLCYIPVIGWLAAIVVLASARFRNDAKVRFDAFQGLYLFVAWLIVDWVLGPFFHLSGHLGGLGFYRAIPGLMKAALFVAWVFMIIKASHNERFKLPVLGELAEKSLTEQR